MARVQIGAIDRHIGNRIKTRRNMLRVSQTALSEAVGLSFQQIQKYEKGRNHISVPGLIAVARALHCPVTYFLDGAPGYDAAAPIDDPCVKLGADRRGMALAVAFLDLDDEGRSAVLTVAGALARHSTIGRKAAA